MDCISVLSGLYLRVTRRGNGGLRGLVISPREGVNDGIDKELCTLSYISVDDIVKRIVMLKKGALMAKVDIKNAYRLLPVHPEDRLLLGMEWQGQVYVDTALPFGLRSVPKIFTALADLLEWKIRKRGVDHVDHYLDDFIILGPANDSSCRRGLDVVLELCERLGVPLAMEKLEGPTTCLTFLGIEGNGAPPPGNDT